MWFKQCQLYQFEKDINFDLAKIELQLQEHFFKPCANILPSSCGWIAPLGGDNGSLIHAINDHWLICLQIEEKILPNSVVNDHLKQRVKTLEREQGQRINAKEKKQLRDDIYASLLPSAFTKKSTVNILINTTKHWLAVNVRSTNKAEDVLSFLRKSLGSLPVKPLADSAYTQTMTDWLRKQHINQQFALDNFCLLLDPQAEKHTIRCQQQDLSSSKVLAFIDEGMLVNQVRVNWQDQLSFIIDDKLSISALHYADNVTAQLDDIHTETAIEKLDAEFFIMSQTLSAMIDDLKLLFSLSK